MAPERKPTRLRSHWQRNGSIKPTTIDPGRASGARESLDYIDADNIEAEVQGKRTGRLAPHNPAQLRLIRSLSFPAQIILTSRPPLFNVPRSSFPCSSALDVGFHDIPRPRCEAVRNRIGRSRCRIMAAVSYPSMPSFCRPEDNRDILLEEAL